MQADGTWSAPRIAESTCDGVADADAQVVRNGRSDNTGPQLVLEAGARLLATLEQLRDLHRILLQHRPDKRAHHVPQEAVGGDLQLERVAVQQRQRAPHASVRGRARGCDVGSVGAASDRGGNGARGCGERAAHADSTSQATTPRSPASAATPRRRGARRIRSFATSVSVRASAPRRCWVRCSRATFPACWTPTH